MRNKNSFYKDYYGEVTKKSNENWNKATRKASRISSTQMIDAYGVMKKAIKLKQWLDGKRYDKKEVYPDAYKKVKEMNESRELPGKEIKTAGKVVRKTSVPAKKGFPLDFNGFGLSLNLGYLGIGFQRIFQSAKDVDYIYFQYNHNPGTNICSSLFKVYNFDEENYKGWFVDGDWFVKGLGVDLFTSPEVEEPVCKGWGINMAYPPESGFSVSPQYYDTPMGWVEKFSLNE